MTVVALRLEIPTGSGEGWAEIPCEGVVVRCRPLEDTGGTGHEVAVFFQGLDPEHRRLISRYVERHVSSPAD